MRIEHNYNDKYKSTEEVKASAKNSGDKK